MYNAVVFDFGNVLCRIDRPALSDALSPYCHHDPSSISRMLWEGDLEKRHETGVIDSRGYHREVAALLGAGPELDYETFRKLYMLILKPNPDGIEALHFVKTRKLRSFILSNISFLHSTWLFENEDLASIPELHILSYKVGAMKPDPLIWQSMLRWSGLSASECLYVDDIPAYCDAARNLGFGALNYDFRRHNLSRELGKVL